MLALTRHSDLGKMANECNSRIIYIKGQRFTPLGPVVRSSGGHFAKYLGGGGGGGQNFQHVCLRCPFKICESFKYNAWYIKLIV